MSDDAIAKNARHRHVIQELSRYAGVKKQAADYTMILCPFHQESRPSGRIGHAANSRSPGYFKCYGCPGEGNWNEIAPKLGLLPFTKQKPKDEFMNLATLAPPPLPIDQEEQYLKKEQIKFKRLPVDSTWRGVSYKMLRKLRAKLCITYNEEYEMWTQPKLFLPVLVDNERVGYIKAALKKPSDGKPSYINASGAWSKRYGLFPFDQAVELMQSKNLATMTLVEGPRDAIRLLSLGIPAVCILGTHSWSEHKLLLLETHGVNTVVIMMDGDGAGIKATKLLHKAISTRIHTHVIKLWSIAGSPWQKYKHEESPARAAAADGNSLWDPGCVPVKILKRIKKRYFSEKDEE